MPATLGLDLEIIASAFVVVVVGGLGSIPGAFLAALLICSVKAVFVFLGQVQIGPWMFNLSKLTLLAEFAVMAVVLVVRPWGLLGKAPAPASHAGAPERPIAPAGKSCAWPTACCWFYWRWCPSPRCTGRIWAS